MTGKDEPIDLGDRKAVTENNKKVKRKEDQFVLDLHHVLDDKQGRRLIWSLIVSGNLFTDPHVPGDVAGTEYNVGHAAYARKLFAQLNTRQFAQKYALMVDENATE
jgi:hypothetical protein